MSDRYLIWSHEHGAWFGPERRGYTLQLAGAGRYSHAEAMDICHNAMPGTSKVLGTLPELPVAEADVLELHRRFREKLPHVPRETWEP
jgi:hypothetical protein